MQLKTNNLKFLTKVKYFVLSILMLSSFTTMAQEIIEEKQEEKKVEKNIDPSQRIKLDGVAAVIGDYVVLDSDIDKRIEQARAAGQSLEGQTRCEIFGSLLEEKLYMHHSIQDSIVINDAEISLNVDQQLNAFVQQIGSMEKLLAFYKKDSEQELRDEMFAANRDQRMVQMMQQKVIEEVEVTPEEVRQFYNRELKAEPPMIGTELRLAQIVVIPETTPEEEQKVIDQLNEFRTDVLENGASFTTKAVLYSEDEGSKRNGGKYSLNKKRPQMVKEFREVAFSLEEGEISKPFKTEYGYHIIQLEKIRGQEYDVRHILLKPKVTNDAIAKAKEEIEKVREKIIAGDIAFADAALEVSDEEETKFEGGQLINPETRDYVFPLTKIDPELYVQVQDLKNGEVSPVYSESDLVNQVKFKILTVTDRIDEHEADFAKDYLKIKELALYDKQLKVIGKWQKEKIMETYIKINGEHRECNFEANWLKKEEN
ncbi:peptidylprolyl isomerase [Pontimicrobium aquaticum]|uniref:Peptidylprolyl isomerase n=1 Tax=Pontimicrobium aquaticum TaxID=2565367 RepID=A0A4U0ELC4_9FLAO|nr:peptidylprolyl isomerase [Pontimicrobium aquaticum]